MTKFTLAHDRLGHTAGFRWKNTACKRDRGTAEKAFHNDTLQSHTHPPLLNVWEASALLSCKLPGNPSSHSQLFKYCCRRTEPRHASRCGSQKREWAFWSLTPDPCLVRMPCSYKQAAAVRMQSGFFLLQRRGHISWFPTLLFLLF